MPSSSMARAMAAANCYRTPNYKIRKSDRFRKYLFENSVTMKFRNFSATKITRYTVVGCLARLMFGRLPNKN